MIDIDEIKDKAQENALIDELSKRIINIRKIIDVYVSGQFVFSVMEAEITQSLSEARILYNELVKIDIKRNIKNNNKLIPLDSLEVDGYRFEYTGYYRIV